MYSAEETGQQTEQLGWSSKWHEIVGGGGWTKFEKVWLGNIGASS